MIAAGTIIVVVLAVFGWLQLRDRIADQGIQAADTCVEGPFTLLVTVDPDISAQVSELAARFTDTRPVVRDHCVSVAVSSIDSAAVAAGLAADTSSWDQQALGPKPALWIPQSSNSLTGVPSGIVSGTPRSVARSSVVLAGPNELIAALSNAGVGWADIARLQSEPDALSGLGLPDWGGVRLELPTGPGSASTIALLAAVATSTSDPDSGPLTPEQIRRGPTASALSALARTDRNQTAVVPDSTEAALQQLGADLTPGGDVHAVPATDQQVIAANISGLSTYAPSGSSVVADHPATVLSGEWTDETASRAASQFVDFLGQSANATAFTDSGFETAETDTDTAALAPDTADALLDAVQNPATPRRTTVLLDVSGSMETDEGGRSRLQNTVAALNQQFEVVVGSSDVGLWVYSKDLDGQRPYRVVVPTGPVDDQMPSGTRRSELVAAADALEPRTATSTYESVMAAYLDATDNYMPGRPNSIVLVTDGPNDDTSISSDRFLSVLAGLVEPDRPVSIDVVSIGTNSDIRTLESLSASTGGSSTTVASSDSPDLKELLRKLLY